ncbi:hypothetical protein V6N13_034354 [Hibiscus sabdariffa]
MGVEIEVGDALREFNELVFSSATSAMPVGGKENLNVNYYELGVRMLLEEGVGDEGETSDAIPLNMIFAGEIMPNVFLGKLLAWRREVIEGRS